ncbi:glycosyltransferase [Roseibium sp.]|uniref:glycosyltransferase n=1 Tax=Roseibium sp. TaxID=1936156 RepID=UPI003A97E0FF
MRILMPCAAFPPFIDGGGPVSSMMLAKMLIGEGHDVRVVHVSDEDRHETYEGIPVHRIKSLNLYWNYYEPRPTWQKMLWHALENGNPRAFFAMSREIADFKPDLVLTVSIENINVATWAAAKAAGVPVAHTVFSSFMMCWNGVMQKNGEDCQGQCRGCRVTSFGRRQLSRLVDTLIGESHDIIQRHLDEGYFPNAESARIPAAIEEVCATEPRPFPKDRPFRIGFLGVHTRFKGLGVLADAARTLSDDLNIEFVIGGKGQGPFAEEVRTRFPQDRTRFLGWTTPKDFFPQIDSLVYPTLGREAFGRASIEAFSHAVPVISTDRGGVAENIDNGVNGYHFVSENVAALRERIEAIASDPRAYVRMSEGALRSAHLYLKPHVGRELSKTLEATFDRVTATKNATDSVK